MTLAVLHGWPCTRLAESMQPRLAFAIYTWLQLYMRCGMHGPLRRLQPPLASEPPRNNLSESTVTGKGLWNMTGSTRYHTGVV